MVQVDDAIYKYFMGLEDEKQRDVVNIQRLLNRVAELEKEVKEARRCLKLTN